MPEKIKGGKRSHVNPSSTKKNCVVKQKQVLVHLKSQYYYLKKIKRKESKPPKFKCNKEELFCKAEASAFAPEESIVLSEEN